MINPQEELEYLRAENARLRDLIETREDKVQKARASAIEAVHSIVRAMDRMA
jgi:hypothetical protein